MKIDILYQFDENYAPYAGVSVYSLFCNNRHFDEINVYVLDNHVSAKNKQRLSQMAVRFGRHVFFLDTDKLTVFMEKTGIPKYRGSYSANMKIFAESVLPAEVKKILYIDSDSLVVGPLDGVLTLDMEDKPIAMVIDSIARGHKKHIGFSKDDRYYNSGIILFDMEKWREVKCTERIIEHVKNVRAHYLAPDQDLLNVVLKNEIKTISLKYNFQPLHRAFTLKNYFRFFSGRGYYAANEVKEAAKAPVILHFFRFIGEFPWDKDNMHPFGKEFEKYLRRSPWKDYKKKPVQRTWIFNVEKWLYRNLPQSLFLLIFKVNYEYFMFRANRLSLKNRNHQNM